MHYTILQSSECDAPMVPFGRFIRFFPLFAVLFSVGCGLFSSGVDAIADVSPTVPQQPAPVTAPVAPSHPKQSVRYNPGSGHDRSYQHDTLTEDVVWSGKILVRGGLTIAPQATLSISPGTVVSFVPDQDGTLAGSLLVQGRITVAGSADRPVVFKAATADVVPGSWRGIIVLGSDKRNVLEHCRIEGASVGLDAVYSTVSLSNTSFVACGTGARLQNSLLQARYGSVSGCAVGYLLVDSDSDIRGITCTGNTVALSVVRGSLSLKDSSLTANGGRALEAREVRLMISGTTVAKNSVGLVLADSEGSVEACGIIENREYGLKLLKSRMKIHGNRIYMNTGVGIMTDTGGSVAWGNTIALNGLHDVFNAGTEEFRAMGNWWGAAESGRNKRIHDRSFDPSRGPVLTEPALSAPPAQRP